MKTKLFTLLFFASVALKAQTQIPNGGFETWTAGNPQDWGTSDGLLTLFLGSDPGGVEQETTPADVYAGNSSLRVTNKEVSIPGLGTQVIPGVASLGTIDLDLASFQPVIKGMAYTDRPDSVLFAAKYNNLGDDSGAVIVRLTRWDGVQAQVIGFAFGQVGASASYIQFTQKVQYSSYFAPDTLLIQILSSTSQFATDGSAMWLDDLHFTGLDTAFQAYIQPPFPVEICSGDDFSLTTDPIPGNTYQWYKDGVAIASATFPEYSPSQSGNYWVEVVFNGNTYVSDTVPVTVHPNPTATLTLPTDTACLNAAPFSLSGGSPAGGFWDGDGVDAQNEQFNPASAGLGTATITYTYTDDNGCSDEASATIVVIACSSIELLQPGVSLNIYPNPTQQVLIINGSNHLKDATAMLFDLNGRQVSDWPLTTGTNALQLPSLPAGSYVLQVNDASSTPVATARILINR